MSLSRLHDLYAIKIDPDSFAGTPVILDGVMRQNLEHGFDVRSQPTSGNPFSRFVSIVNGQPSVRFGVMKIADALDTIGPTGLKIASATQTGLTFYAYAHDEGSTRKSGANHRQFLVKKGLIVPRTLSVDGQGDAEIDYDVLVTKDGSNDPIVESDAISVPALSGDDERFGIGPVTLGSVSIPQLTRVELDFGLNARAQVVDGEIFPTFASIKHVMPKFTFRGVDVEWLKAANIPRAGKALTHLNTAVYFRKRAIDAQFVANATTEHIQVTTCGLAVIQAIFGAEGDSEGECSIEVTTRHDGTNNPLVFDTTAAIP